MTTRFAKTVLLGASLFSMGANAQDYKCRVERMASAADHETWYRQRLIGKQFSVNRTTGVISGPAGLQNSSHAARPIVVDHGSKDNSFKAVTTLSPRPGSLVWVLVVDEYRQGKEKPFAFMDNSDVFFGTCVHFE